MSWDNVKKKKKFYIVCSIECVLSMKKIKEKAFVIKKQEIFFLILLFIIHIYVKVLRS